MTADKIHELSKTLGIPYRMFREYVLALYGEDKLERLRNYLSKEMYLELSGAVASYIGQKCDPAGEDASLAGSKKEHAHSDQACATQKSCMHATKVHETNCVLGSESGNAYCAGAGVGGRKEYTFRLSRGETIGSLKELILSLTALNDVVCIRGDTGCGKSTLIPQFLLEKYSTVICTQPRRLAAISIAKYVKKTLGTTVGYKVRFEEDIGDKTRLIYVTDGILLRNSLKSDILVVDEAHERTVNIDILLAMRRKMVIMSATLSDEVVNFFNSPLINIEVERFPVEVFYLRSEADDYLKETIETTEMLCTGRKYREIVAKKLNSDRLIAGGGKPDIYGSDRHFPGCKAYTSCKTGDVLVFLPGQEEIRCAYKALKRSLSSSHLIIPLHSSSQSPRVFMPSAMPKIILATNIAETSITLDVDYVIDSGYFKQKTFMQVDTLFVARISKSQAKQRAGRVGRVREGVVYRIYSKKEFEGFQECIDPEILRINLCNVVLLLTSLRVDHTKLVTSLPEDRLAEALGFLESIGALKNGALTGDGKKMSTLPLHVQCAKTLLVANRLGVAEDVATIISMLSVPNIIKGEILDSKADLDINAMRKYENARGDHYTLLSIYRQWERQHYSPRFLETNGMNVKNMQQVRKVKEQLMAFFSSTRAHVLDNGRAPKRPAGIDMDDHHCNKRSCPEIQRDERWQEKDSAARVRSDESKNLVSKNNSISQAFLEGFKHNIARKRGDAYITVSRGEICYIHPSSVLYGRSPEYILFNEVVMTKKEYMRWCMALDSKDLDAKE